MAQHTSRLPNSILIANRGEIAVRIARTCRDLGIKSISVYSDADRESSFVSLCDRAVPLTGSTPSEGYMDGPQIIEIAQRCGAEAIHPGYGFLSENADFARACQDAGLIFIGPSPEAIAAMGDKIAAKRIANDAGVSIVPGVVDEDALEGRDEKLIAAASELAFPLLIKASAGGGGRGMRIVATTDALPDAIAIARREAAASFGNDRLLVERYVANPRHIEVQIFGDRHGGAIHLYERDCSVQRRHQKIIEEAPAPNLKPETLHALHDAAVTLARATSYDNAGTVEFVLDAKTQEFFFLEVNTRLQVEHPVTEVILGLDLVEWQIRIAAGQHLPLTQDQIIPTGSAIEVRLTAEDAAQNFLPQTGRIAHIVEPKGEGIRLDTGVGADSKVTPYYDSMLAKVIAHGPDRETAIRRLDQALASSSIMGLKTNSHFLRTVLQDDVFLAANHTTHLVENMTSHLAHPDAETLDLAAAIIAAIDGENNRNDPSPWQSLGAWRSGSHSPWQARTPCVLIDEDDKRYALWIEFSERSMLLEHVDTEGDLPIRIDYQWSGNRLIVRDDKTERAYHTHVEADKDIGWRVHVDSGDGARSFHRLEGLAAWRTTHLAVAGDETSLRAPGPGLIASVAVKPGDTVATGAPVLVIESMKMLQTLTAPCSGEVANVCCTAGQSITKGDLLIEFNVSNSEETT